MINFNQIDPLSRLTNEIYYINDRIMTGDICSSKTALPKCNKICNQYIKEFIIDNYAKISLEPYCAAGGWVGLTYSFVDPNGNQVEGSFVPRRYVD